MSNLIELKNISKSFPTKKTLWGQTSQEVKAVNDVSVGVVKSEHLAIVGESGCGKTTLAKILLKLIAPDVGQIFYDGNDVTKSNEKTMRIYRDFAQMVFQDPKNSLDPRYTIEQILAEPTLIHKVVMTTDKVLARMGEMLKAVGLSGNVLSRFPHEFSGGERQRIAIARALMIQPKVLVLDEAVSSLDVITQNQILDLLKELQKNFGLTYVFITHNLKIARSLCPKTIVMYRGRIVESALTREIFAKPLHKYTQSLLTAAFDYKAVDIDEKSVNLSGTLQEKDSGHFILE